MTKNFFKTEFENLLIFSHRSEKMPYLENETINRQTKKNVPRLSSPLPVCQVLGWSNNEKYEFFKGQNFFDSEV